ncbi:hypothetical protein [Spirosoma montaniterrae]|uniref:Uncharacterized protein n=1 Tax=Spirosoma montaniterrae TaxID=1178516 RepID=A0A1P9WZK9_9BACT|nr:hypothetical protein [Spirosoma montaniterrae]AQG80785.1 hypothetical protein AWR27_16550 [Spirosoma montaniterrae]
MENLNNSNQQRVDQSTGGPLEGVSPQRSNALDDTDEQDVVAYAGLGVNNSPDVMNPGEEEATDTLLYTDTVTARHATDEVSNADDTDDMPIEGMTDEDLDDEISRLADEEGGGERY